MGEAGETADAVGARDATAPLAWADGFMDVVAKYERNASRQLYLYGISVSRCARCRHRLKAESKSCEGCGHELSTKSQACSRCRGPQPGLWCYECDAYFCEPCHAKPHVLVLGGSAPQKHHCYPIDGSSGKMLHHGAWSESMLTMVKDARRAQMKTLRDAPAAAESKTQASNGGEREQRKMAAKEMVPLSRQTARPDQAPPAAAPTSRDPSPVPRPRVQSRSPSPSPTHTAATPAPSAAPAPPAPQRPTIKGEVTPNGAFSCRKRKSPTADATAPPQPSAPLAPPPPAPARATNPQPAESPAQPVVEADGMSLYERLRQMHSKQRQRQSNVRIKTEGAAPRSAASSGASTPTSHATVPHPPAQPVVPPAAPTPTAQASRAPTPPPASSSAQPDRELEEVLMQKIEPPPTPLVDLSSGSQHLQSLGNPSTVDSSQALPSATLEDPLTTAVVEEYDRANAHVARLESQLQYLNTAVRRASVQNVAHAAQINDRIGDYRRAVALANEARYRALAKVVLFSHTIRAFARSLPPEKVSDFPHILTASHNKCAQLAAQIAKLQEKHRALRQAIDEAVSSGEPEQLALLPTLGGEINETEEQIRQTKMDRDGQFKLMVQFSKKLRDAVMAETAAMRAQATRG